MRATILPLAIILTKSHSRGQYGGQGEYCGPSTASEVFLIFTTRLYHHVNTIIMQWFSYLDKRKALQHEYSQYSPLLTSEGSKTYSVAHSEL